MVWSLTDWSRVRDPDAKNDEDVDDMIIVDGLLIAPGLTVLQDEPKAATPEVPKAEEKEFGGMEVSPNAARAWQRSRDANMARLATLTQGFDDAVETRRRNASRVMRDTSDIVLVHPRGGEAVLAKLCEAGGESEPGSAAIKIGQMRADDNKGSKRVRVRDADSETRAIRTMLGLEGSSEVHYPAWVRTWRNDNRVRRDKNGAILRKSDGTAKPGRWRLLVDKLASVSSPSERLEMWNNFCENTFARMGLARGLPLLQASTIDGRTAVHPYTSLSTSTHNPIPMASPVSKASKYHPSRETYTEHQVALFKEAAARDDVYYTETLAPPKGHHGPIGKRRTKRITRCKMTGLSMVETDKRAQLNGRIDALTAALRAMPWTTKHGEAQDPNEKTHGKLRKLSGRLVNAERKRARSDLTMWAIAPHVNGYARDACRVLITAAAVMSGLEKGKIEFDRSEATSDEIDQYERATMLAKDSEAFCALAVAIRHPDYVKPCAALRLLPTLENRAADAWEIEDDNERATEVAKTLAAVDKARAAVEASQLCEVFGLTI